jgi:hypothetical protein
LEASHPMKAVASNKNSNSVNRFSKMNLPVLYHM